MTTTAPLANSRTIGLAHYAARAVLERVMSRRGLTFLDTTVLRPVAAAEKPLTRERLVQGVTHDVKVSAAEAGRTLDELTDRGLLIVDDSGLVRMTDAGRELYDSGTAETAQASARIWADIPEADLAAAGRVLALVTERANAELAAAGE
ncbi:MarR family transcriptional regulator [Streptomyces sp. Ru71]|uniref:MarR family transcriptional regulator n=1 Tax=Streptomyces sp. Ru71 TaxID=2080746 RepID=UPI000CDE1015|nr:MarR family transcriptional regulator [Streptomyces sp. Ru71]POX46395.1 MarR family transcriptional regulator [Streptomyces sp. Ru71]